MVRGPQHRGAALGARYGRARRNKFRGRATKFPSSHPRKFRGAQIRPRNSREFLTPYLQPYSEVASGYSLGNCARRTSWLCDGTSVLSRRISCYGCAPGGRHAVAAVADGLAVTVENQRAVEPARIQTPLDDCGSSPTRAIARPKACLFFARPSPAESAPCRAEQTEARCCEEH